MRYAEIQKSIEQYFSTNWTETAKTFENAPFDSEIYNEFSRLSVRFGTIERRSLGISCFRVPGVAIIQLFVRPGIGINRLVELSDTATALFMNTAIPMDSTGDYIQFNTASLNKMAAEYNGWIQANVSITFYHDIRI